MEIDFIVIKKKITSLVFKMRNVFFLIPQFFLIFLSRIFADSSLGFLARYVLWFKRCGSFGENVYVSKSAVLKNPANISIGSNVSFHDFCYIDAYGPIVIKDNVSIAHACSLISFDHTWSNHDVPIKYNPVEIKPILIKSDVWIGCGVRVLGGVTIGSRSVVAAGSVVTKDVPPNTLVAGCPAKVIKKI